MCCRIIQIGVTAKAIFRADKDKTCQMAMRNSIAQEQGKMTWKSATYDWNRQWHKAEDPPLISDDGFTYVSNGESSFRFQESWSLEELENVPCLVLLGEPGMGKTHSIRSEYERLRNQSNCLLINLGLVTTRLELQSNVLDAELFSAWLKSERGTKISIFFDSFDECTLSMNQFFHFIENELSSKCSERLEDCLLRVVCRDFRWKVSFEERLRALWGNTNTETYRLLPLRRDDALLAAAQHNIDGELFNTQVKMHSLESFAATPLTLIAILRRLHEDGSLPSDQWELFDQMIVQLCTERNDDLQSAPNLSAEQKRAIAARIAYLSMFSNRNVIDMDQEADGALCKGKSDLLFSDMIGGSVCAHGESFVITKDGVKETLHTSLFKFSSEGKMTWVQKSYCEYLAAHYLQQNGFSSTQIANLFLLNKKCIPQLAETAVWLSTKQPELFAALCRFDVPTLFSGDGRFQDDDSKRKIVDAAFQGFDDSSHLELLPSSRQLAPLVHPGLGQQITAILKRKNTSWACRRFAINLAEACNLSEVQGAICKIALSASQDNNTRREACHALARIADDSTRSKLIKICQIDSVNDPQHDLLGNALIACYPRVLPIELLLEQLVPPAPGYIGMYAHFIGELPTLLKEDDIPEFLNWAANRQPDGLQHTIDSIILRCLRSGLQERLDFTAFIRYLVVRWENNVSPVREPEKEYQKTIWRDDELRKRILNAVIESRPRAVTTEDSCAWIIFSARLTSREDFSYICELLCKEEIDVDTRELLIGLACRLADWENNAHWELLLRLKHHFEPNLGYFCKVEAKAPRAISTSAASVTQESPKENKQKPIYTSPREVQIDCLAEAESGDFDKWWKIAHSMIYHETGTRGLDEDELDITQSPGWQECTQAIQARLLNVAHTYLEKKSLPQSDWLGKFELNRPCFAVCKAFILLLKNNLTISDNLRKKWVLELLAYANRDSTGLIQNEVSICMKNHPSETAQSAAILLKHDARYSVLKVLTETLDATNHKLFANEFIDQLLSSREDSRIEHEHMTLLEMIQERFPTQSSRALKKIVSRKKITKSMQRKVAIAWALLARAAGHAEWLKLSKLIEKGDSLSQQILLELSKLDRLDFLSKLTEDNLRDLYLFLANSHPQAESPGEDMIDDAEWTTVVYPEGTISGLRQQVFSELSEIRQNELCCRVLRELVQALPHYVGLPDIAESAIRRYRSSLWAPLSVSDLKTIATSQDARIIQDENQLADCVLESLNRLQEKLQREQNPAVLDLWNECGAHYQNDVNETSSYCFTPKAENRVSDYLVRFLRQDLLEQKVILCREAEIRAGDLPGARNKSGSRRRGQVVDIYLAIAPHTAGAPITVVVEVKGCWNKELNTAMERQLRDRYMKNNGISRGIFAVAYFHGEHWPSKYQKCANHTLENLSEKFEKQSLELSGNGCQISAIVLDCGLKPS